MFDFDSELETLKKETKIIALCRSGVNVEYQDTIMNHVCMQADKYGYHVLVFSSFCDGYFKEGHDVGELNIFNLINYKMVDGVIMLSETIKSDETVNMIACRANEAGVPVISIDKRVEHCYNIIFNYRNTMEQIVRHFVEYHGFTKLNFLAGIKGNSFSEERLNAYRKVLAEHNIPIDERRIGYGEFWADPTYRVIDEFMKSGLEMPEAFICSNDTMAMAVCERLKKYGYKVPDDVKVSGFDGIEEEKYHTPRLTTAKQDFIASAKLAVDKLHDIFNGKETPPEEFVEHEIVIAQSCGCVKCDATDSNAMTRELYIKLDNLNQFEKSLIRMTSELSDGTSMSECMEKLKKFVMRCLYFDRFWVIATDEFIPSDVDLFEDTSMNKKKINQRYSENGKVLLYRENSEFRPLPDFPISHLVPYLAEVLHTPKCHHLMFSPLHYLDNTIGYTVININPISEYFRPYYSFIMNLSNVLEVVRTHAQMKIMIDKLEDMYVHDPLTGLYNRRGFYKNISKHAKRCLMEHKKMMIISIDLDGLKYINDVFGHSSGDNAIKTVASALLSVSINNEICARFGGDEFVVGGTIEQEGYIDEYIRRFKQYLDYYNKFSKQPYKVQSSCGVLLQTLDEDSDIDKMIEQADVLMYQQKAQHKYNRGRPVPDNR